MSYTPPIECSYPQLCKPNGEYSDALVVKQTVGPYSKQHSVRTDYTIDLFGHSVPIVKTVRDHSVSFTTEYGVPTSLLAFRQSWGTSWIECQERAADKWISQMVEDCAITKSTLHYLDSRYGVCLYKEVTQSLKFDITGRLDPTTFKFSFGNRQYHKMLLKKQDLIGLVDETWYLIKDGIRYSLSTSTQEWTPYFQILGGKIWTAGWEPDPDVVQGFVFPQPPSIGICLEDEISYYGFYDYANDGDPAGSALNRADGGCMDFFYPDWCRQMQEDPFWKAAAERRFQLSWNHEIPRVDDTEYIPPEVTVDPVPLGTYVKHPIVGEVYQFLVGLRGGGYKLETSPNIDDIINNVVPEDQRQQGTTLYYPIGVL